MGQIGNVIASKWQQLTSNSGVSLESVMPHSVSARSSSSIAPYNSYIYMLTVMLIYICAFPDF